MKVPWLFTSIIAALFFVIVLLPISYMLAAPFWLEGLKNLDKYAFLFDDRNITLAKNSLVLASGTTTLSLIIGIFLAFLLHRTNLWGKNIFKIVYIIPILIPPYIHAIVWNHLNAFIKKFSLDIHSLWGAIFVLTLAYFPFVTLMALSGLESIDKNLEEASLLCRSKWQTIIRITLPLITPHIFSGAIFVFIFSIIDFGVPDILRVNVYPVEIFIQFNAFYDEKAATILSLPLIGITLFLIILQKWHMKNRSYVNISGGFPGHIQHNLGRFNTPAFSFCCVVISASVVIPIAVLFKAAGSFSNYTKVMSTSIDQIAYSLVLAFLGGTLTLFLAFSLSYIIERTKSKKGTFLEFALFIPLAIPAITLGIGLIKIWNCPVIDVVYGSSLIIIFGYISRFIPFAAITTTSGLKQNKPSLEEAAFISIPSWNKVMRKIVLPLSKNSLITGFFIVFVLSFGELGTTLLVIPPGRETIPIKIYNLMHYGADHMVAALCLILIAIILTLSGLFLIFHKKFARST